MKESVDRKKRSKKIFLGVSTLIFLPVLAIILIGWKIGLGLFWIILIIKIIKIRRRGYFVKDNYGEELKFKKFMSRWKDGIEGITPLQQARTNLLGTWITLTGIISGIIINALVRMEGQWVWIEIILLGSLVLVVMQMISGLQRYWKFKETDKIQKKFEADLKRDVEEQKALVVSKDIVEVEDLREVVKEIVC